MKNNTFKLSTLAIVIGMNVGSVYAAQNDAEVEVTKTVSAAEKKIQRNKEKDNTEVIVVTGIRDSLSKALSHKKFADFQMDVISAEDIGKLPDVEIGDVLERIAGVQVNRGDDGVVNGTNIRGLPGYFNRTLYNGRVFSTSLSTERYFDSQVVPAAFMNRVEVHKTAVSNVVEGGLAGVINLKSIRAFDIGKRAVRLKATASNPSNISDINSDVLGVFSDLFLDESLGFTVGVNHLQYDTETQKSNIWDPMQKLTQSATKNWDGTGENIGENYYVPSSVNYAIDQNYRERTAAFTNLEWRPTPDLRVFGEVFYSKYETLNNRNNLRIRTNNSMKTEGEGAKTSIHEGTDFSLGERNYLTAFHPTNAFAEFTNQYNERESDTAVAFFDVEWLKGQWSFKFGANVSKSRTTQFQVEAFNISKKNYFDVLMDGSDTDKPWAITFYDPEGDPGYSQRGLLNDASAPFTTLKVNGQQLGAEYESNSWGLDFDGDYEFNLMNDYIIPTYLQFGLHYTEDESLALKPQANFTTKLDGLMGIEDITYRTVEPTIGDWFDGGADQSGAAPLLYAVPDISALIETNNWSPESMRAAAIANDKVAYKQGVRDDLKEDIGSAYLRLNFENGAGDLTGNIGLRYVHTKQFVTGEALQRVEDNGIGDPNAENYVGSGFAAMYFDGGGTVERSYYNYLPSLNLRYMLTDELAIRGAWSQTMTRPLRGDLKLLDKVVTSGGQAKVISPDPQLDAFISENVDLSIEWYYDKASALTLALFYKDVQSLTETIDKIKPNTEIWHVETQQYYEDDVLFSEKSNSNGTIIQGTTVGFEQPFTALPSFLSNTGVKINYTYIDNSRPDLMKNISKDNLSATMYYDGRNFDARLSYAYRGERSRQINRPNKPDQMVGAKSTLNASFSYKVNRHFNIGLGISNITDQPNREYLENGMTKAISDTGRTVSLTFTGRM